MGKLTFRHRPSTAMVVVDRNSSSRTMSFHALGHILAAVARAEVVSDIVVVEAADWRMRFDWVEAVGFLC